MISWKYKGVGGENIGPCVMRCGIKLEYLINKCCDEGQGGVSSRKKKLAVFRPRYLQHSATVFTMDIFPEQAGPLSHNVRKRVSASSIPGSMRLMTSTHKFTDDI